MSIREKHVTTSFQSNKVVFTSIPFELLYLLEPTKIIFIWTKKDIWIYKLLMTIFNGFG